MRNRTVVLLVAIQVVLASALVVVAWTGQAGRADLRRDLNAANDRAKAAEQRAATAETRAADLQTAVDALSAACCRPGVARPTNVTITTAPHPGASPTPVTSPAPRGTSTPRPSSSSSPSPSPSPTCRLHSPVTGGCIA